MHHNVYHCVVRVQGYVCFPNCLEQDILFGTGFVLFQLMVSNNNHLNLTQKKIGYDTVFPARAVTFHLNGCASQYKAAQCVFA